MSTPKVNTYDITIEKVAGFKDSRETFSIESSADDEAFNQALATMDKYGPTAIVVDVKLVS